MPGGILRQSSDAGVCCLRPDVLDLPWPYLRRMQFMLSLHILGVLELLFHLSFAHLLAGLPVVPLILPELHRPIGFGVYVLQQTAYAALELKPVPARLLDWRYCRQHQHDLSDLPLRPHWLFQGMCRMPSNLSHVLWASLYSMHYLCGPRSA